MPVRGPRAPLHPYAMGASMRLKDPGSPLWGLLKKPSRGTSPLAGRRLFRANPSLPRRNQPPLPPLVRGVRKSRTPSARRGGIVLRRGASPFYTPLTRGGRGGCLSGCREDILRYGAHAPTPDEAERTFSTTPLRPLQNHSSYGRRSTRPGRKEPPRESFRAAPPTHPASRHHSLTRFGFIKSPETPCARRPSR